MSHTPSGTLRTHEHTASQTSGGVAQATAPGESIAGPRANHHCYHTSTHDSVRLSRMISSAGTVGSLVKCSEHSSSRSRPAPSAKSSLEEDAARGDEGQEFERCSRLRAGRGPASSSHSRRVGGTRPCCSGWRLARARRHAQRIGWDECCRAHQRLHCAAAPRPLRVCVFRDCQRYRVCETRTSRYSAKDIA